MLVDSVWAALRSREAIPEGVNHGIVQQHANEGNERLRMLALSKMEGTEASRRGWRRGELVQEAAKVRRRGFKL